MVDLSIIRENPDKVAEKSKQKGYPVDIPRLLELDNQCRELQQQIEQLRAERNELAAGFKNVKPSAEQIERGKQLKDSIAEHESRLVPLETELTNLLKAVPNMPLEDVPVGASEDENVVVKTWGDQPKFEFEPLTHWQLAEQKGWIDKQRAAKVAGSRFAYIKGDLVQLQFAIMQFVIDTLTSAEVLETIAKDNDLTVSTKPFIPVLPPLMIRTDVFDAMDRLEPRDDRYKLEGDDLWLQGSAEHTLGSMHMDETFSSDELPLRYVGYATSFRREAGTYGKDTEGIIRMHQFDKLEMEIFSTPDDGRNEHLLLVAIQEYMMQQLGISYQLLLKCTADIGKPNARGMDINAWMPGQGKYRETHTADYMTDYQSRRLKTRFKHTTDATSGYVHTNDATAFALGRTMVAIIENYQDAEGNVRVPEALQGYMKGRGLL